MKLVKVVVIHQVHQVSSKSDEKQKSFINRPFFCSEFQTVSRIVKIVHSAKAQAGPPPPWIPWICWLPRPPFALYYVSRRLCVSVITPCASSRVSLPTFISKNSTVDILPLCWKYIVCFRRTHVFLELRTSEQSAGLAVLFHDYYLRYTYFEI